MTRTTSFTDFERDCGVHLVKEGKPFREISLAGYRVGGGSRDWRPAGQPAAFPGFPVCSGAARDRPADSEEGWLSER